MKLYRVVVASWVGADRVETDIGCQWKSEALAKKELKELSLKHSSVTYSLQRKK